MHKPINVIQPQFKTAAPLTAKPIKKYFDFLWEEVTTLKDQVGILLIIKSPMSAKWPQIARDGNKLTSSKANEKYIGNITKRAATGAGTPIK